MKPGIKPTELWVSLTGLLGGLGALFGLAPRETVGNITGAAGQAAGGLIAGPAPWRPEGAGRRPGENGSMSTAPRTLRPRRLAGLSALGYAMSRGKTKGG
jgi:hypothetical protein